MDESSLGHHLICFALALNFNASDVNLHYYTVRHSLTEIKLCRNVHVQGIPVC